MTDLTEQWKKGELPEGFYYVNDGAEVKIDYYLCGYWEWHFDSDVYKVLAPVPSYNEWKAAQEQLHKEGIWYTEISHKKVLKENAQLKELLKECKEVFDECFSPSAKHGKLYKKIEEALK